MVGRYRDYLFKAIYAIVRHPRDAEDITQETLLQIFTSLPQYQHQGFKTWITRIAVNKAIDFTRKAYRKREELTEMIEEQVSKESKALTSADENGSELSFLIKERRTEMRERIESMPKNYRDVIYAYYFEEKTYQQIADETGIEVKSVASRLHRARNWIRKNWKEDDFQ